MVTNLNGANAEQLRPLGGLVCKTFANPSNDNGAPKAALGKLPQMPVINKHTHFIALCLCLCRKYGLSDNRVRGVALQQQSQKMNENFNWKNKQKLYLQEFKRMRKKSIKNKNSTKNQQFRELSGHKKHPFLPASQPASYSTQWQALDGGKILVLHIQTIKYEL